MPRLEDKIPELQFWGTLNDRHLMISREDDFQPLDNFKIWDYLEPWVEAIQRGEQLGIFAVRVTYTDIFRRTDLHTTLMVYSTRDGRTIETCPNTIVTANPVTATQYNTFLCEGNTRRTIVSF